MTYLLDGAEFSDWDEVRCYSAMSALATAGRTANTSQIARQTGLPRSRVDRAMTTMSNRGYVRDAYKGNAHHWRGTGKIPAIESPAITAPESAPSPSTTPDVAPCGMSAIGVTGHDRVNATLTADARHTPDDAPRWNCVDYPDGMHLLDADGGCRWCGRTREQIAARDKPPGCPECPEFPGLRCVVDHTRSAPDDHYAQGHRW